MSYDPSTWPAAFATDGRQVLRPGNARRGYRYRELPGERCRHGMLPPRNCPTCYPRAGDVLEGVTAARTKQGQRMAEWWRKRREALQPPADGRYRCTSGARCVAGPDPKLASEFYADSRKPSGLQGRCKACFNAARERARGRGQYRTGTDG